MKLISKFAIVLLGMLMVQPAAAQQIDTLAKQAIIVDYATGSVLFEKNADERMPTSSMSKTMTAYMLFDALKNGHAKLTDSYPVSEKAWAMQGSKMFIMVGSSVPLEELIRGILIQSGNDATIAAAEGLSGSEEAFVNNMNTKAQELGMTSSHFMNASGWPVDDHYSTARDLSVLAKRIIADFPEYYPYFSEREFTYNKIKQQNRDPLLGRVPGADGLKTGHTDIAGYGLIGSAQRDGRRVILVMNGLNSEKERQEEGVRLMEWAFRNFENKKLVTAGDKMADAPVWLGSVETLPLVAEKDVEVVMPRVGQSSAKLTAKYDSPIKAPVKKGDKLGTLEISFGENTQPMTVPLLAGADVAQKGWFGRTKDRIAYKLTGKY